MTLRQACLRLPMQTCSPTLRFRCSGRLAVFSRPEFKTERFTYQAPTPSALRGIAEAILFKPAMRWHIERIHVLKPIRFMSFRRNEVNNKAVAPKARVLADGGAAPLFYADEDRAQRNTVALTNVDYLVEARLSLTDRAGDGDSVAKFVAMFERRLEKGQHFHQPYFGCRECAAEVRSPDGSEKAIADSLNLGIVLWDIAYHSVEGRPDNRPIFFWAQMKNGIIDVPDGEQAAGETLREYQLKGGTF